MLVYVIIRRYFIQEILKTLLAVLSVLLLIALSNRFVVLMGRVARGELSGDLLFTILGFHTPELIAFLLPLSFFLTILLVLGRWYVDKEITAAQACGLSWRVLMLPLFSMAFFLCFLVSVLTTWVIPAMNFQKEAAFSKGELSLFLDTVSAEHFHSLHEGRWIFYVEKMDDSRRHFYEVFIAEQQAKEKSSVASWRILMAEEGYIRDEPSGQYFVLKRGVRYEGEPGKGNYTQIHFEEYARSIESNSREVPQYHRLTPTAQLWNSEALGYQAELQWRLSIPLTVLFLAALAVPLSAVQPRGGRYVRIFPAIIIYIGYYNLLTLSKRWIGAGVLPPWIGMSWIHALVGVIALILWAQQMHYLKRKSR